MGGKAFLKLKILIKILPILYQKPNYKKNVPIPISKELIKACGTFCANLANKYPLIKGQSSIAVADTKKIGCLFEYIFSLGIQILIVGQRLALGKRICTN